MNTRRGLAMVAASLVLGLAVAAMQPRAADAASNCGVYASDAVDQQATNLRRGCGYTGPRWSSDWGAHYNWCLGVSDERANDEIAARRRALNGCR